MALHLQPDPTVLCSFSQILLERRKEKELLREAQEATGAQDAEAQRGLEAMEEQVAGQDVEATGDSGHPASEPEVRPEDQSPAEEEVATPGIEKGLLAPRGSAVAAVGEGHEKVASSREKRESRRQRGLEHVELQNRHVQAAREERRGSKDEDPHPNAEGTAPPTPLPQAVSVIASDTAQDPPGGSPGSGHVQRPTSLALDGTPAAPKDRSWLAGSPRAQDRAGSPGAAAQIQRYQPPDAERLASAVEQWRGRKLGAATTSATLSQSLDLSDKHRTVGAALTPAE